MPDKYTKQNKRLAKNGAKRVRRNEMTHGNGHVQTPRGTESERNSEGFDAGAHLTCRAVSFQGKKGERELALVYLMVTPSGLNP